jgi:transcriptional regulator with XRE-family HTH domain
MGMTAATAMGLVPHRRLGAMLAQRREMHGYELSDMARRSMGQFSVADLEAIEAGSMILDDAKIEALSLIYEFNSMPPSAHRSRLIIADDEDLPTSLSPDDFTEELVLSVLQRYVALLYLMRSKPVGELLQVRADDAQMLGLAFNRTESDITALLERIMVHDTEVVQMYADRMRRRLVVPAAGMLVGPTPLGMLVLVK